MKLYIKLLSLLLLSLFIYTFYRTADTVVNRLLLFFTSDSTYQSIRQQICTRVPLNPTIIFSLPEALWVYCSAVLSKPFFIQLGSKKFQCIYIPIGYAVVLEILQWFQISNGYFDWTDIVLSSLFWIFAYWPGAQTQYTENLFGQLTLQKVSFLMVYAIVYLSHVMTS